MCVFPETRRADDFVSMTYNNNLDVDLTDIENDEVYLEIKGATDGNFYSLVDDADVASTPELRMTPLEDKPDFTARSFCLRRSSKASCQKTWASSL